jgi:hypothetical protein
MLNVYYSPKAFEKSYLSRIRRDPQYLTRVKTSAAIENPSTNISTINKHFLALINFLCARFESHLKKVVNRASLGTRRLFGGDKWPLVKSEIHKNASQSFEARVIKF